MEIQSRLRLFSSPLKCFPENLATPGLEACHGLFNKGIVVWISEFIPFGLDRDRPSTLTARRSRIPERMVIWCLWGRGAQIQQSVGWVMFFRKDVGDLNWSE